MFSFKSIVLIAAAFVFGAESSAIPAVAAPLVAAAPAAVGYAHGIPQNVPPFASQVSVVNRAFSSPFVAAPAFAAPYAAAPAPFSAAPYVAGPAPVLSPYSLPSYAPAYGAPAPYAAPFPYSAPFLRSPYFAAPAFVR